MRGEGVTDLAERAEVRMHGKIDGFGEPGES